MSTRPSVPESMREVAGFTDPEDTDDLYAGQRPSGPCGKCGHPGPPDPSGYAFQGIQAKVERQRSVINQMVGKGIPEVVRDLDTRSDLRFGGPRIAWEGREWVTASQFQALMDDRNRLAKWVTELLGAKMDGESRLYGKGTPPLQNDPSLQEPA